MNKRTTVTTESGAEYIFDSGYVCHRGRNLGPWRTLRQVPDSEIEYGVDTHAEVHARMTDCAPEDLQVGNRFYVGAWGEWRLASVIVKVVTTDVE